MCFRSAMAPAGESKSVHVSPCDTHTQRSFAFYVTCKYCENLFNQPNAVISQSVLVYAEQKERKPNLTKSKEKRTLTHILHCCGKFERAHARRPCADIFFRAKVAAQKIFVFVCSTNFAVQWSVCNAMFDAEYRRRKNARPCVPSRKGVCNENCTIAYLNEFAVFEGGMLLRA